MEKNSDILFLGFFAGAERGALICVRGIGLAGYGVFLPG
jgi:hypothetical protein